MKKILSLLIISIIFTTATANNLIDRNINNFILGETVMDSARAELTKADYKFTVSDNKITVTKYWYEKYCFDNVTFSFIKDKLNMVTFTQNCFDLSNSDKFGKDFLQTLENKYGEFRNHDGIYTKKDGQTLIRLAQQQNEDRTSKFNVIIVDLIKK